MLIQWVLFFLFPCKHSQDPPGTNFAIFQITKLIFSSVHSCLVVICQFVQMSWSRSYSFPRVTAVHGHPEHTLYLMSLSPQLKCTTTPHCAHMYQPPPHCAHIQCLVFINIQQASRNVSGCHFFHIEEFSDTPLLQRHFHFRWHFVIWNAPVLPSVTWQQNVTEYW